LNESPKYIRKLSDRLTRFRIVVHDLFSLFCFCQFHKSIGCHLLQLIV